MLAEITKFYTQSVAIFDMKTSVFEMLNDTEWRLSTQRADLQLDHESDPDYMIELEAYRAFMPL